MPCLCAVPGMDAATGAVEVALPPNALPRGWMQYNVMLPDYHLVTGNMGSVTLLQRK